MDQPFQLSEHEDARADGDIGRFFHDVVACSFIFQYGLSIEDQVIQPPLVQIIDAATDQKRVSQAVRRASEVSSSGLAVDPPGAVRGIPPVKPSQTAHWPSSMLAGTIFAP